MKKPNLKTLALVSVAALAIAGTAGAGAQAASLIGSRDIRDGAVHQVDLAPGVKHLLAKTGKAGVDGVDGKDGKDGVSGTATYVGANWSIVDRNVEGGGDAYLRSGPAAAPSGVGSLGIRTGSPTDKTAFGNEIDFAGQALPTKIGYSVFTTGENIARSGGGSFGNMPSIAFEIDPNLEAQPTVNYSTLVYAPGNSAANKWTTIDAVADTEAHWALTGKAGTATGCSTNGAYCTYAQVVAALSDGGDAAKLLTAQITKGKDYAFSGAVDNLVIGDDTYDFEPFGVTKK